MTPDYAATATARRARASRAALTRRHRNADASRGTDGATARALAAGLWRLRHAERMQTPGPSSAAARRKGSSSARAQRGRRSAHLCQHDDPEFGVGPSQCQCQCHGGILEKAYGSSWMEKEKATKWDKTSHLDLHRRRLSPSPSTNQKKTPADAKTSMAVRLLEAELERARARVADLEAERRATRKRLERFLRKAGEEKAALRSEARHRRELEAANAKLLLRLSQQARGYETERRARELMEEACSELTREVEADQAEVELLRNECLRMREEMEEERRMLQMAEVWREERVQMKLADARLALDHKYDHLNRLQAEMEAFLRRATRDSASASAPLREARVLIEAASARSEAGNGAGDHRHRVVDDGNSNRNVVDVDSVFEHFRRKEKHLISDRRHSPTASSCSNVSPATDLFLAKADDDGDDLYSGDGSADDEGGRNSCSWLGTTDPSVSAPMAARPSNPASSCLSRNDSGGGGTDASRRSTGATKNTALIRRLWRSAITESRNRTGHPAPTNGWSASDSDRKSTLTAAAPPVVAAEQCSSSKARKNGGSPLPRREQQRHKQSLKEKLMEARMDDHRDQKPPSNGVKQKP